ncbi:MAG: septal ring factor EnvC (AmiA/AmiB activator) [Ilumatobacter sp.]
MCRPRRTARCSIPPCFADLRSEVANRLAAASKEVDVERQQAEDVHARIAVAEQELVAVKRAIGQFQPTIDQARQAVDDAQREVRSAHRRLERGGRVKWPARREAKRAANALEFAHDRLDEARALAAPTQDRTDAVHAAIDNGESSISTLRTHHRWNGVEARRDHLVNLDGALAVWQRWAAGEAVVDADVANSVGAMTAEDDSELQQPIGQLTRTVTARVERAQSVLLLELEVEPIVMRRGGGIEL